jgi:hypothetical protein
VDKQSFYKGINETIVFSEDFFKKVYGYSIYDDLFLSAVATKLNALGRKDIVQAYNEWFTRWGVEDDEVSKRIANWYQKECDKEFEKLQKEQQRKVVIIKNAKKDRFRFNGFPQIV